ncbi:MAG: CPBP family intramembrane metalloprotease [Clostridiales bacterium]|nr:CPBP family intramembrane metalloprotease [Clostridiales bacterium]
MSKTVKITGITVLLFIFQYAASRMGSFVAGRFDYSTVDKDGLFMSVAVHHIIQMLAAILVIALLTRTIDAENFKLKPKADKKGIIYTLIFCLVLGIYYLVVYIIGTYTHTISVYDYELNRTNVLGTLGFQLLLSGPSEELLFRSLPLGVYLYILGHESKKDTWLAIVLASVLFGIAHIDIVNRNIPWFQVGYAMVLGTAYGYTFVKSKSIIYPMIMHSMSNVISVGGCYIYMMMTS